MTTPQEPGKASILIFNFHSGGAQGTDPEQLCAALAQVGYQAEYRPTESEADLEAALAGERATVFVAGGDGTIRSAALHLAGRPGALLGVIPMGTANNIGKMLGVPAGAPLEVIASYGAAQAQPFDLGHVTAPWGKDLFLEACGCGAFAEVLTEYNPEDGKSPLRAVQALGTALSRFEPVAVPLRVDEETLPDLPYALLEVMNTKATGPRLRLASSASPHDGLLDVVRVDHNERDSVLAYLAALARDEFEALPSVQTSQSRAVTIPYHGQAFHVDGEARPAVSRDTAALGTEYVRIEVWPGALRVLLPATEDTRP